MNLLVTLLSPSSSLSGFMANAYKTESQLNRFMALREKSGALTATESILDAAQHYFEAQAAQSLALLDNMELCDKPPVVPTFKSVLEELGVSRNSPGKSEFWRVVESVAKAGAVRRWDTRLQIEAYEATQRGWLLVFDTITYDPSQYSDEVMFGKYWRRYQRSVQHAVVRRAFGSVRKFRASGKSFSDFVRYFAVPESHKDGRTHVHVLWFVSDLPDTCALADPNAHMPPTPRRQVDGWPPYPYGMITMRLPVRYRGDAFSSRLGWRLPLDKDGKRPILKDSIAVARYMSKYLSKPKPETLKCRRIRTSPRLGLLSIQAKLSTLTNPQLCLLYRDPRQGLIQRAISGIRIPTSLLRSQVLRLMVLRFRRHLNPPRGLMRTTFDTLRSVLGVNSRAPLQEHFTISTLQAALSRLPSFLDSVMNNLSCSDISDVSSLFTDYDKPVDQFGHAPTFAPSVGALRS